MIITIDGPAGSGKSTVAKKLAERLGFTFFDTGAMYRAVTYCLLERGIPFDATAEIISLLHEFTFSIETVGGKKRYFANGEEVTEVIRSPEVTGHVSKVSSLAEVRHALVDLQRRSAKGINAVFEGRDLGTVVFPKASLKIFLIASPEIRAERRYKELIASHPSDAIALTPAQILQEILHRDHQDSTRDLSPLRKAPDAHEIDTSYLTIEEVIEEILRLLPKRKAP